MVLFHDTSFGQGGLANPSPSQDEFRFRINLEKKQWLRDYTNCDVWRNADRRLVARAWTAEIAALENENTEAQPNKIKKNRVYVEKMYRRAIEHYVKMGNYPAVRRCLQALDEFFSSFDDLSLKRLYDITAGAFSSREQLDETGPLYYRSVDFGMPRSKAISVFLNCLVQNDCLSAMAELQRIRIQPSDFGQIMSVIKLLNRDTWSRPYDPSYMRSGAAVMAYIHANYTILRLKVLNVTHINTILPYKPRSVLVSQFHHKTGQPKFYVDVILDRLIRVKSKEDLDQVIDDILRESVSDEVRYPWVDVSRVRTPQPGEDPAIMEKIRRQALELTRRRPSCPPQKSPFARSVTRGLRWYENNSLEIKPPKPLAPPCSDPPRPIAPPVLPPPPISLDNWQ